MKKKIISFILAISMIATLCISLTACGSTTKIDLNEYMNIETEGYDGSGIAYTYFNFVTFDEDYDDSVKFTKEGEKEFSDSYYTSPAYALYNYIIDRGVLDKSENLSNGDEITFSWNINNSTLSEIYSYFDVNLEFEDITVTVSNLERVETFDAFEDVTVSFSGTQPNGQASIVANGKLPSYEYSIEPVTGLSNGDTVTISLEEISNDYYISNYGAVPEETSREYTVEGLPYYITALSEIPDEALQEMDAQAQDALRGRIASSDVSDYETIESADLLGCYLLTPKQGFGTQINNDIYLVYQINMSIHNIDENGHSTDVPFTFYRYYEFSNGMILPDGTFSIDYSDYYIPSDSVETKAYDYTESSYNQEKTIGYYGYDNLDTLFNNVVTKNIETYNYESSVN